MKYRWSFIFTALLTAISCAAADYPSEKELWNSFSRTPGSRVHVNRVFVNPGREVTKKMSQREKRAVVSFKERNAARVSARRKTLDRIWSDFAPGEKALILSEMYDLFHGKLYRATVITQRTMYVAEINENQEKGDVYRKYELPHDTVKLLMSRAAEITPQDGSCEIVDSTTYPAFVSVKDKNGKWITAVYVSSNPNWKKPPQERAEYFAKTAKIMNFLSVVNFINETREIPQPIIKK